MVYGSKPSDATKNVAQSINYKLKLKQSDFVRYANIQKHSRVRAHSAFQSNVNNRVGQVKLEILDVLPLLVTMYIDTSGNTGISLSLSLNESSLDRVWKTDKDFVQKYNLQSERGIKHKIAA